MWKTSIMLAVMVLALTVSAASAANEVYLDPQTVYIPECGNATVQVRMDVTDMIDTWSTMIEFDDTCVNITDVDFTGSVTPTNASWGHHVDYIYLGGTELTAVTGDGYLLATLTIECKGSSCGPVNLNLMGDENIERLVAGLPDTTPPKNGTIYSATWTDGSAQCVGCGDVDCSTAVNMGDYLTLRAYVLGAPVTSYGWASDLDGVAGINMGDYLTLRAYVLGAPVALNCCCPPP